MKFTHQVALIFIVSHFDGFSSAGGFADTLTPHMKLHFAT
jgi:hypothetical protein